MVLTPLHIDATGFILVNEHLHLLRPGWWEQQGVESRVSLLLIDEFGQVLLGHVGLSFSMAAGQRDGHWCMPFGPGGLDYPLLLYNPVVPKRMGGRKESLPLPVSTPCPAQGTHYEVKISSISGRGQRLMRKLLYTDSGKSSGLIASFWKNHYLVSLHLTCSELSPTMPSTRLWGRRPDRRGVTQGRQAEDTPGKSQGACRLTAVPLAGLL